MARNVNNKWLLQGRNNKTLPKYSTDRKLKISVVSIFETKGAKKDKIFNFLKARFSVMVGPMNVVFSLFSETYVRLLKSITSEFFSRYSKMYNNLNVKSCFKTQRPLTKRQAISGPPSYMYLIQLYKCSLEWSWWALWHL